MSTETKGFFTFTDKFSSQYSILMHYPILATLLQNVSATD